jgi:putative DNA methylase
MLIDMLSFIERKTPEQEVSDTAEVLGGRLKNLRAFSQ